MHNASDMMNAAQAFSKTLSESPNIIKTTDNEVSINFSLYSPRIISFNQLLSSEESDSLINMAKSRLSDSLTYDFNSPKTAINTARKSESATFKLADNDFIIKLEQRIQALLGYPENKTEPLQVLRYKVGGHYAPHHDFFDPLNLNFKARIEEKGQRQATLLIYLNDVEAGGSTFFPHLGLDVLPKKGNALFFSYRTEDGKLDPTLLHAGSPITKGEKWVAVKWFNL